ncbi:hypothetical protein Syun_017557 [Stephania yunnanensis]|uniref:Uncharacterized protein n=1 Tax=Stephania yunnanensis TaxID=152371 RepID=A0AAP0J8U4_9MAGN
MSSMKTMTNLSKYGFNTLCIKSMNMAGAFVSPNGIIVNSNNPYLVLNAVLGMSSFGILS